MIISHNRPPINSSTCYGSTSGLYGFAWHTTAVRSVVTGEHRARLYFFFVAFTAGFTPVETPVRTKTRPVPSAAGDILARGGCTPGSRCSFTGALVVLSP